MKAQELRIGNYYLSFGVDLKQVETLSKNKVLIDFNPIPLTEERLLKFGFEKKRENVLGHSIGGTSWIGYDMERKKAILNLGAFGVSYNHIQYVHQLQNLYFALTGEELEMK